MARTLCVGASRMYRLREVVGLERLDKHATCSVFACKDSKFSNVQNFLASRLRCRTWSMMWTLTATVTECVSFMLPGSGSCGTWSWRPGALHDVHIFSFDLNIHRCHPRARRWYRLFDFFICCGKQQQFRFLIAGAGSSRAKGSGRAKDSGQAIGSMQNKLCKVVCLPSP